MTAHITPEPLSPRAAYRLWAPAYDTENAVSALENAAVQRLMPSLAGRALLDVGCGTGRRLLDAGARRVVGIDLVFEMLAAGDVRSAAASRIAGDVRALPLSARAFDTLWCRLVLGHLPELDVAYRELARVAADSATLLVTDFHPAAAAAGHRRTFRDAAGALHSVEHHVHAVDDHCAAAAAAGWQLVRQTDAVVGPEIRSYYERAGALDRYDAQQGLPLVLVLEFER